MKNAISEENLSSLAKLRAENGGVIESSKAEEAGVTRQTLSNLVQAGKLVRIGRGQFVIPKDSEDPLESLVHGEDFIFSHQTALNLHGLMSETPSVPHLTYPKGATPDPVLKGRCYVHYADPEHFRLGLTLAETPFGNLVPAYDLERSLCDVAHARGTVGSAVFLGAITRYANSSNRDLEKLYKYGDELGVTHILSSYLKVLLPQEHLPDKE